MNTKSKQEDPHAQNPHNVINQDQISDVMLQQLKTVKNWANFIFVWAITTMLLLLFGSTILLTLSKLFLVE